MATTLTETDSEEICHLLCAWLPTQRWFGAKGHDLTAVKVCELATLPGTVPVEHLIVAVQLDGVQWQTYQVPLVVRATPAPGQEERLIGRMRGAWVYDFAGDPDAPAAMLGPGSGPAQVNPDSTHGEGHGEDAPGLQALSDPASYGRLPARPMSVEQSNTSIRFGQDSLMKVFRQLTPGVNPDVEVHAALASVGCQQIAAIRGWENGAWTDPATGETVTGHLAMIQELVSPAVDGWDLARQQVAAGVDFRVESQQLGVATGQVHHDLREALATRELAAAEVAELVARLHARLAAAILVVPEIGEFAEALHDGIEQLAQVVPLTVQRVHGDYHLGQVLRSGDSWKLLDFEGEPGSPMDTRVLLDHPLRDVAGMLRSFDYAAHVGGAGRGEEELVAWRTACEDAFVLGYQVSSGIDLTTSQPILTAYLIDKAAYEAVYEKRNRPDWLVVPMAALRALSELRAH
ncbi:MAG: maltokinase N-terminal cap-like domain-containing protein [Candidatus Nanopelagicales bacterium]